MRKLILMGLAGALLATAACNTIEGAGRDVTSAGRAVTGAAENSRR